MAIYNLGSINADMTYRVPHLLAPGETLATSSLTRGLGGKGANMSVAAARAGAQVRHLGAVGEDGRWAIERLTEYGVDTRQIAVLPEATGHAIIMLDAAAENCILIYPGANRALSVERIEAGLAEAAPEDIFVFQNETNAQREAAELASARGLRVAYAAAPFDADAVTLVLPLLDLLVLNEVEAAQLERATGQGIDTIPVRDVVVTLGARGCRWINTDAGESRAFAALPVTPVDTTGAGDTFTGYLLAGLDRGLPMPTSIEMAQRAAAIMVTRQGTADVIPDLKDVTEHRF
ncbi:ribokinase [Salipiger mangrovisoli]|uniref:Ribokinase n=1 Tax=Salipiger mangrovisoli TaxID=2865933 RepID=A0ABR9WXF4_9RHOB|nr:ribokinase [Salipiger mangrovisoli]MBE9635953.1 ribokinase [Salipiger mangrovisoli]